jgi:hypothetical protein
MSAVPDQSSDLDLGDITAALAALAPGGRVRINPDRVEQDLARLVLGLMEFLRQLMELQAIRRLESGTLTLEQEDCPLSGFFGERGRLCNGGSGLVAGSA